jgi:carbonic anhydrase
MNMPNEIKKLFLQNKVRAQDQKNLNPGYFSEIAKEQNPTYLWIGCADSRVNSESITGVGPGEMFVHRNIANLVLAEDASAMSVLEYAVGVLKIKHIIVCGHYNCGGVRASVTQKTQGNIKNWLANIENVYNANFEYLNTFPDLDEKLEKLVELNVVAQIQNLKEIEVVRNAALNRQELYLHGWIYDIHDGLLKNIISLNSANFYEESHGILLK